MRLVAVAQRAAATSRLTFEPGTAMVERDAEHVVLAIPFSLLRQVALRLELPPVKRRVINELGYGTNAKLLSQYAARVWWSVYNANGTVYTDNGLQSLWDAVRGQEGTAGLLTTFLDGKSGVQVGAGTPEARILETLPWIEAIFPGTAATYYPGHALRMHWRSAPFALGSYAMDLPIEHCMTALGTGFSSPHTAFSTPSQHRGTARHRRPSAAPARLAAQES